MPTTDTVIMNENKHTSVDCIVIIAAMEPNNNYTLKNYLRYGNQFRITGQHNKELEEVWH